MTDINIGMREADTIKGALSYLGSVRLIFHFLCIFLWFHNFIVEECIVCLLLTCTVLAAYPTVCINGFVAGFIKWYSAVLETENTLDKRNLQLRRQMIK